MAADLGIIDSVLGANIAGDLYTGPYMNKWVKNVNDKFFKWNGMSTWNDRMRVAAMVAGMRFIAHHTKLVLAERDKAAGAQDVPEFSPEQVRESQRYLDELGIKPKNVFELPDGTLLTDPKHIKSAVDAMRQAISLASTCATSVHYSKTVCAAAKLWAIMDSASP